MEQHWVLSAMGPDLRVPRDKRREDPACPRPSTPAPKSLSVSFLGRDQSVIQNHPTHTKAVL